MRRGGEDREGNSKHPMVRECREGMGNDEVVMIRNSGFQSSSIRPTKEEGTRT